MDIVRKSDLAVKSLVAITIACLAFAQVLTTRISFGGALHARQRATADLIADILPPPAYIIEPYLVVTRAVESPATAQKEVAKLADLRRQFEERRNYWRDSDMPDAIKAEVAASSLLADQFWQTVETDFAPAVGRNDATAAKAIYDSKLSPIYARHDAAIRKLVQTAQAHSAAIEAEAKQVLLWTRILSMVNAMVLLGAIVVGGRLIIRRGLAPIARVAQELESGLAVMAEGDLTHRLPNDFPAEYQALRDAFQRTLDNLSQMLEKVSSGATSVQHAGAEIRLASGDLSNRTEKQALTLRQTVTAMNGITETVGHTAEGAGEVRRSVEELNKLAENGGTVVSSAVDAMGEIERSAGEITNIISMIEAIAFQTNLLALNAGVEAARAGDAGKGFAVDATEVRALAQRSSDAAKNISELITGSGQHVQRGVALVAQSGQVLGQIVDEMGRITQLIDRIAESADRESRQVASINRDIAEINQSTQQNAAMAEESSAAALSLAEHSDMLTQLVKRFRLPGQPTARATDTVVSGAFEPVRAAGQAPLTHGNLALKADPDWAEF